MSDPFEDAPAQTWDPPERERTWYRARDSGQLGWLVIRDGKSRIRLDRFHEEIIRNFDENEWIAEIEHRPITRIQVSQLAYEADVKLCMMLGDYSKRSAWQNLHEDVRIRWVEKGPPAKPAVRQDLFRGIMGALERVSR